MKHSFILVTIVIAIFLLFIVGNLVFVFDFYLIFKVAISELCFIVIYTLIDKTKYIYKFRFVLLVIIALLLLYLPIFSGLFYSPSVHYTSVSFTIFSIVLNAALVAGLLNKGVRILVSSRISTMLASAFEIALFSYLLGIGWTGLLLTVSFRLIYIWVVPKIVFNNISKKSTS